MASMANPTLGLPGRKRVVDMPPPQRDNVGQPPPGSPPAKQYQTGATPPPPGTAYRGGVLADPNSKEVLAAQERQRLRLAQGTSKPAPVGQPTPTTGPTVSLTNQANPDPRLNATVDTTIKGLTDRTNTLAANENAQDPNLQLQIDRLAGRLSNDPTQRAINRVGSSLRGQNALALQQANKQSAFMGGDAGAHGAAINSATQNRLAKASADIALGRERDLDQLTLAGQGIMSAPAQMQLAKTGALNNFMLGGAGTQLNAAQAPSQLALQQQQLGVQQYAAQNNAQNNNAQLALQQQQMQAQQAQQQMQNYMQMLQMTGYPSATGGGGGTRNPKYSYLGGPGDNTHL